MTNTTKKHASGSFAKLMDESGQRRAEEKKTKKSPTSQSTDQSISQPTNRSTDRPVDQSPIDNLSVDLADIVERPKAFYITKRLDRAIDDAVRYFKNEHGLKKADRSTVINAMLDNEENWTKEELERLVKRLVDRLASRLVG